LNPKNGEEVRNNVRDIKEHGMPILRRVERRIKRVEPILWVIAFLLSTSVVLGAWVLGTILWNKCGG
tara:strand:+ start:214 stop:414 length:201 start_codon:yes stop_codon:yes gene_type:complete